MSQNTCVFGREVEKVEPDVTMLHLHTPIESTTQQSMKPIPKQELQPASPYCYIMSALTYRDFSPLVLCI
jgi:hypothetical protein